MLVATPANQPFEGWRIPPAQRRLVGVEQGLAGQVALVTGGASGIGAAVVNYHSCADASEALVAGIARTGGQAVAVPADVGDEEAVAALFAEAGRAFGGLDILVANAGLHRNAPFANMSLTDWRAVLDVDLTGQLLCCREAVRTLRRQGQRPAFKALGKVVCMGSVHQAIPWAWHANYAASKGGVMLVAQSLAQEVAAERIRVNIVAPGAIRPPSTTPPGTRRRRWSACCA